MVQSNVINYIINYVKFHHSGMNNVVFVGNRTAMEQKQHCMRLTWFAMEMDAFLHSLIMCLLSLLPRSVQFHIVLDLYAGLCMDSPSTQRMPTDRGLPVDRSFQ